MKRALTLLLLSLSGAANAMCFAEAANRYRLPEDLLRAIAKVESSNNPAAMNMSHAARTKSYDIGLMQINSSWLGRLGKMGITEAMLREPCQNLMVGAWILSHHLRESGADWNGVGSYNASCRTLSKAQCANARNTYSWKVYRALMKQRNLVPAGAKPLSTSPAKAAESPRTVVRSIQTVVASSPASVESKQAAFGQASVAFADVVEGPGLHEEVEID